MLSAPAFSQTVTGKITAGSDGQPLPGVSVLVKGTTSGTTTDAGGKFSINAPAGSSLVASFIGFKSQEVLVGNKTAVDIILEEDATVLGEVIVTALGIAQEKRAIGYAVQQVKGSDVTVAAPVDL
eukprot:gene12179-14891_t